VIVDGASVCRSQIWLLLLAAVSAQSLSPSVTSANGLRLMVDVENGLPALHIRLPIEADSEPGIFVLFPEHVTARQQGQADSVRLYLFRPGPDRRVLWRRNGQSIEYEMELRPGLTMRARATTEDDGIRYRYDFINRSSVAYDTIQAVTDPRMVSPYFRDVRLERTYVHHQDGFALIAAESPDRLSLPLDRWLPNRHRVPYSWPIDADRIAKQPDGIVWYNNSRRVDEPLVATQSTDGQWIMATFSYDPGNVWTNPELTCQHADPQVPLPAGHTRSYELKTLIIKGSLQDVLSRVRKQRGSLEH
jgi:hypothetical protein